MRRLVDLADRRARGVVAMALAIALAEAVGPSSRRRGPDRGEMERQTGFLGLGSNQGERRVNLEAAVAALGRRGVEVVASSSVYETEPVGEVRDQPDFLNACLRVRTSLGPDPLLDNCKAAEREVGRSPEGVPGGPRLIDVDLLLLGDVVHSGPRMRIPHPEIEHRRFVLVPLLELEPGLALPDGRRLETLLAGLGPGQWVRRAGPPLLTG